MRLTLVHDQFGRRGGLEGYLLNLSQAFVDQGHHVNVITSRLEGAAERWPELRVFQVPPLPLFRGVRLLKFNRDANRAARKIDADFVLGFGRTVAQDVHRAGGGCHRVYSRMLPPWRRWSIKNQIELDLERRLYTGGATRRFVVNAEKVRRELLDEYGVDPAWVTVLRTPVDRSVYRPWDADVDRPRDQLRRAVHPSSDLDRPAALFVSLAHRRKGLWSLLEIWDRVDSELWVAGGPLSPRHRAFIRARGLERRVVSLGRRQDLPEVYRAADLFVHPTRYDACANAALQSMASGLPGVISAQDGASELVRHGQSGWVLQDPQDPQEVLELVRHLERLSPEQRRAVGAQAAVELPTKDWSHHASQWIELLQGLGPKPLPG